MLIRVVLADNDEKYIEYFRKAAVAYAEKTEMSFFTREENLKKYLIEKRCDLLLISETMEQAGENFNCAKVILTEEHGLEEKNGYRTIYKYQKLENIYRIIVEEYAEQKEKEGIKFHSAGNAKMVSFISAGGGVGKTTACFALAKYLCRQKKEVLYVPLEQFSNINYLYPGDETQTLTNLFYAAKEKKSTLNIRMKGMIHRGEDGMLFLRPADQPNDADQMTGDNWNFFLNALADIEDIDYILLDHTSGVFKNFAVILDRVEQICMVADRSLTGIVKATGMVSYFQRYDENRDTSISKKIRVIVNRARAQTTEQDFSHLKNWIVGYLPDYGDAEMEAVAQALTEWPQTKTMIADYE